jgi:hypothetical protein
MRIADGDAGPLAAPALMVYIQSSFVYEDT